ncbi:MAG: MBL fold metallo-hydrolase [Pyrodictiaceae archaeon]
MLVVFLGTGGAGAPPGRAHNCLLVETEDTRIILDVGEGCSQRLMELGYSLCDIDYVYISHLHFDHYSGLADLAVRGVIEGCRRAKLALHKSLVEEAAEKITLLLPRSLRSEVSFYGLDDQAELARSLTIRLSPTCHTVPTYSIALAAGGSRLFYTADTRPCKPLYDAIASWKPDLLIHEATLPDGLEEMCESAGHSTVNHAVRAKDLLGDDAMLALVHLSVESEAQLRRARRLPRGVFAPYDKSMLSI